MQWVALVSIPTTFVSQAFPPGRLQDYPVANPLGAEGALRAAVTVISNCRASPSMFVALVGAAVSMVVRSRRSRAEERLQIKWVATAAALFVALFVFPSQQIFGEDAGFATLLFGLLIVAAAVAISILKYRLYDIDVVINRRSSTAR